MTGKELGGRIEGLWSSLVMIRNGAGWERKLLTASYVHHRDDYEGTLVPRRDTYDASPQGYLDTFLSGFVGYMMPEDDQWAELIPLRQAASEGYGKRKEFGDIGELDSEPGLLRWCSKATQAVLTAYSMAGYYAEMRMMAKDYLVFGTGYMMACEGKSGGVYYRCFDPQEVCIAENGERKADVFLRRFSMDARDIVRMYPEKDWANLRQRIKASAGERSDITCYEAIVPSGYLVDDGGDGWRHYLYVSDEGEMAFEGSFDEFPVACVRRNRSNAKTPYGIGLVEECLPSIVQLDDMGRTRSVMRQKNANPPMVLPYSLKNAFSSRPGSRNYVPDMAQAPRPVQDQYNASEMLADIQDMREQLRMMMGADLFRAVMGSADSRKTAYEVSERKNEAMTLLQMQIGTFRLEAVSPLFKRTLRLLHTLGAIPWGMEGFQPRESFGSFVSTCRVELNSVFVRRVEAFMQYQQSMQTLQAAQLLQQVFPTALMNLKENSFVRGFFYGSGVPRSQMEELKAVEKKQREYAQIRAQQYQSELAATQAGAIKDLSGAGIAPGGNAQQ